MEITFEKSELPDFKFKATVGKEVFYFNSIDEWESELKERAD